MKHYLIINESHPLIPFVEKYLLFKDRNEGLKKLKELGWEDDDFTPSDKIGKASVQQCGNLKLWWLPIEAQ